MDGEWTLPIKPTACSPQTPALSDGFIELFPQFKRLSDNDFVVEQVRALSADLKTKSWYCPATWTARAYNLLRLGYPELAVGDAYKATMLMSAYKDPDSPLGKALKDPITQQMVRQTTENPSILSDPSARTHSYKTNLDDYAISTGNRAALVLAQALFVANCFVECKELLQTYKTGRKHVNAQFEKLAALVDRAVLLEGLTRARNRGYDMVAGHEPLEVRRSGCIIPQTYPWMLPFLKRQTYTIEVIEEKMASDSEGKCLLVVGSELEDEIARNDEVESEARVIGIEAAMACSEGELLLDDYTFLSGMDDRTDRCYCCGALLDDAQLVENTCCDARFCNERCQRLTVGWHRIICPHTELLVGIPGHILKQDNISPKTFAYNELLSRLFAYVQSDTSAHTLRLPIINAMAPAFRTKQPDDFSLADDIKRPMAMLSLMGPDMFTDHGLDTWILQTITARLRNNLRPFTDKTGTYHIALNTSYMFFNHSCNPNVRANIHESGSSRMCVYAKRDIAEFEELYVSYVHERELKSSYFQRQFLLKTMLGGPCRCSRCKDELESIQSEMRVDAEVDFLLNPPSIEQEISADDDATDEDDDVAEPPNRYASDETLNENHPTMTSLLHGTPDWTGSFGALDVEDDVDVGGDSPLRSKGRSSGD